MGVAPKILPPFEGPTIDEFLIANRGRLKPVSLETGKRYRYVHPEALAAKARRKLDQTLVAMIGSMCLVVLVIGVVTVDIIVNPREDFWPKIGTIVFYLIMGIFMFDMGTRHMKRLKLLSDSVYDSISVDDAGLTVRRGEEVREFSREPIVHRGPKFSHLFGNRYAVIGQKGNRYIADLRYLREVPPA